MFRKVRPSPNLCPPIPILHRNIPIRQEDVPTCFRPSIGYFKLSREEHRSNKVYFVCQRSNRLPRPIPTRIPLRSATRFSSNLPNSSYLRPSRRTITRRYHPNDRLLYLKVFPRIKRV